MTRPFVLALLFTALLLSGCGKFFQTSTGGGGGTTPTNNGCTNCAFVGNANGLVFDSYNIGTSGTLSLTSATGVVQAVSAIAISPVGPYVYAGANVASGAVTAYSIDSTGTLTVLNGGNAIVSEVAPVAIAVDSTGSNLYILNAATTCSDNVSTCFSISSVALDPTTGGILSGANVVTNTGKIPNVLNAQGRQMVLSPDGVYLYAAMGTGGILVLPVSNTAAGNFYFADPTRLTAVNGIAVDATGTSMYAAISGNKGGLAVYSITNGVPTAIANSPFTTGDNGTHSEYAVTLAQTYVYVSNAGSGTITGYATADLTAATSSTPTALNNSPYTVSSASGTLNTIGLATDATGSYILAINRLGGPDLGVYAIGSDGSLGTAVSSATTGVSGNAGQPIALAVSSIAN